MLELRLWVPPPKKKARGGLASKVDRLAADMEHVRSLLLALLPGTGQGLAGLQPDPPSSQFDDALSLAASANFLNKVITEGDASHTLDKASSSSAQSSLTPPWRPSCVWLWLAYSSMLSKLFRPRPAPSTGATLPRPRSPFLRQGST